MKRLVPGAGLIVFAALILSGCSADAGGTTASTPTPRPPAMVTAAGTVVLSGTESITNDGPGTECWAYGNDPLSEQIGTDGPPSTYADVKQGAQVVITDASGKVVGTGTLDAGVADPISDGQTAGNARYPCDFTFTASNLPGGGSFYGIKVGTHSQQVPGVDITAPTVHFGA